VRFIPVKYHEIINKHRRRIFMKKVLWALLICLLLAGCRSQASSNEVTGESITVSVFDPMPKKAFLEEAAQKYQELHPDVTVNIQAFADMPEIKTADNGDGKTVAMISKVGSLDESKPDYINKINTELMSGQGADLIAVDVIPYYSYIEKGLFEDLGPLMASLDMSDLRGNIIDAAKIGGKQYFLPLDYGFSLIAYEPSLFTEEQLRVLESSDSMTIEEMADLAATSFDPGGEARMFSYSAGAMTTSLFDALLSGDYMDYADIPGKTSYIGDGSFAEMLETALSYEEKGYIPASLKEGDGGPVMRSIDDPQQPCYFKNSPGVALMNYFSNYYNKGKEGGLKNRIVTNGISMNDTDELMGLVKNSKGQIPFTTSQAYAMNANSKNKELAWDFLKFLLSYEVQMSSTLTMSGLPVNKKAFEDKALLSASTGEIGFAASTTARQNSEKADIGEINLSESALKALDAYKAAIEKYTAMLDFMPITDETITSAIRVEAASFFKGQKTAESAANAINGKVSLYLNE
jgi:multiple sugar transport system substrate-binding protein